MAATIFGMLGRCSEAEDVGQMTFVRFYQSLKHFRGESTVGTYLIRIAINLSLNELKRRKRRLLFFHSPSETDIDIESLPTPHPSLNAEPEQEEIKSLVQRAIRQLAPKFRSVIVLRLIDGYSTQETAHILNLPLGTVLSRLARAQMKLKKLLEPYIKPEEARMELERPFFIPSESPGRLIPAQAPSIVSPTRVLRGEK